MVEYKTGNIFDSGCNIIGHQVNCKGVMGSGIARQVKDMFPMVFLHYSRLVKSKKELLGHTQLVSVGDNYYIANLFAQDSYGSDKKQYTNYEALHACLISLYYHAYINKLSVALPKNLGCCRGGGDWKVVKNMIESIFKYNIKCEVWGLEL